ncbi:MAG: DUF420 domain-containing protein [Planctomycetes bacterium]|nr:DUF420 domain-containing protein [Planctomycetota bacterium]
MFGTKASLLVDLFLVVLLVSLPAMLIGIALVRRGRIAAHRAIMVTTFLLFLAAVIAFEISVRFGPKTPPLPLLPLLIHLLLALPCLVLWALQMASGKRAHLEPRRHRRRGMALLLLLSATVLTGFWLYHATFVA